MFFLFLPSSVDYCNLPFETGMCKGLFYRFFYDPKDGNCKQFVYGGCQGNQNNFRTGDECVKACSANGVVDDKPLVG